MPSNGDHSVPSGLDALWVLIGHAGDGRRLALDLKYRGNRRILRPVSHSIAQIVPFETVSQLDLVTFVPTSAIRRHSRGFDQAQLLSRSVARHWGLRSRPLLRRTSVQAQTGRSAQSRSDVSFTARRRFSGSVCLVDDVVTTGASLSAAAIALRNAGASSVIGVAIARTPAMSDATVCSSPTIGLTNT
jgi:predicted amidophosphoribosyltransferase